MAIETVSLYVLGLVAVGVVSYLAGRWRGADDRSFLEAKVTTQQLLLDKLHQQSDQVHDAYLRVNKMNTDLIKKIQSMPVRYDDVADEMYHMLNAGFSRREIANRFGVCYSTVCYWLRKKSEEYKNMHSL